MGVQPIRRAFSRLAAPGKQPYTHGMSTKFNPQQQLLPAEELARLKSL